MRKIQPKILILLILLTSCGFKVIDKSKQSDFFINTANVIIQYIIPEYFTFHPEQNLNMSHGF